MKTPSLKHLLKHPQKEVDLDFDQDLKRQQKELLLIQQGIWHSKSRVILAFEGFDASGKGGVIQRLTEPLDPRGFRVHPIGPPTDQERGHHYLERFWSALPAPGSIAIFDRTWYGRVLVEKVEGLVTKDRAHQAYDEINEFERMLRQDGIQVLKFFIAVSKGEQLKRYQARLNDPMKQWKLTEDDLRNRKNWDQYVKETDLMFEKTSTQHSPWNLIPGDHKHLARHLVISKVNAELVNHSKWMRSKAAQWQTSDLKKQLKKLK